MSAQYDYARPAKQVYPMDTTRLHMASKNASYIPPHPHHSPSSRRPPVNSTSLPSSSWLSEAAEFVPHPPSQLYLGVRSPTHGTEPFPSSRSASESSQHYRTGHGAQSRDYLSTSPSPSPHTGSRTQSRHTPSPVPSPSQTLHPSRSFTAPSPHKTSGMSSDRDASGHLDMKRLMSKPARQVTSGSLSLPSDSERSGDASSSRVGSSRRPSEGAISHPPLSRSASVSREKLSLHVNTAGLRSSSAPRPGYTSSPERNPDGHPGKPPRNVLRRRPSSRSNPSISSGAVHHTRAATDDVVLPSRSTSTRTHQTALRDDTPVGAYAPRSMTSPSASAARPSQPSRMKRPATSPRSPQTAPCLTPAGAVALAYKQQERRREELAETASFNDAYQTPQNPPKPIAPSARRQEMSAPTNLDDDEDREGGEPYYTVFGSSSGRVVAVGSPEDDDWLLSGYGHRATVSVHGKPTGGTQSLSRKVSGSLKRVTGSIKRSERDHRDLPTISRDEWKPYDGSRGVPGRSSPQQKTPRRPVALDMSLDPRVSPKVSPITKASPATKGDPSALEDGRASRSSKTKGPEDDNSTSGKWWKLMKRISTGGLREKYQQPPAPPPVPALPRNLQATAPSRTTMDISSRDGHVLEVGENGVLLRRFMQSRASMSGVRPMLSPPKSSSSRPSTGAGSTVGRPSTAKSRASMSVHRPSTRSSSPGSSEKASSAFFNNHNPAPSTRSSFSSFGDEIPPVPKNVGQYIIPPSELSRMAKSTQEQISSSPSQSQSRRPRTPSRVQAPTAPLEEPKPVVHSSPESKIVASLPLPPPRRAATTGGIVPSPIAPSFNVEDTINTLMPPMHSAPLPLTEFGMKEPPPRPKRSSRRAPPPSVDIPARSQSMSATMPHSPATPRAPPQVRVDVNMLRRPSVSASSHGSTPKQISASPSSNSPASASALSTATSPMSAVSQKRSPLTFREIESPRHRLTEKEKADKWEDLLERSARAGGTLHIGESHLLSDQPDIGADESFFDGSESDADA